MGGAPAGANGAARRRCPTGNPADAAAPAAGADTGPVTNTTAAPATTSQPATANPAAVGAN